MSESGKIDLVVTKNGKPVRHQLTVPPRISFEKFNQKIKRYTTKRYRLEYQANGRWEELTEPNLRALLKNYKREPINIRTDEREDVSLDYSDHSEMSVKSEVAPSRSPERQDPPELVEASNTQLPVSLAAEIENNLTASGRFPELREGAAERSSDFADCVRDIVFVITDYAQRELQRKYKIVREKEQALDLGKTCGECNSANFRGPYYLCLVCPNECVLCGECEAKEELRSHPQKSHPFAKIKRTAQTIKTRAVTTVDETDLAFEEKKLQRGLRVRPQGQTEEEMGKELLLKFETLYQELISKSDYHRLAFTDPDKIARLKKPLFHRSSLVTDPQAGFAYTLPPGSLLAPKPNAQSVPKAGPAPQGPVLSDKEKLRKAKKLNRMNLPEALVKKYTSGTFENASFVEVAVEIEKDLAKGFPY